MRVVHLDGYFDNPEGDFRIENEVLSAAGLSVCAPRENVWDEAAEADVILVRAATVGARDMDRLKRCRVLIRYGIGLDKIDLDAARAKGIAICNTPGFCVEEMSEHTLTLALALTRRLHEYQKLARNPDWSLSRTHPIRPFRHMRFISIGFGRIAREVLLKAKALGFQVAAADPFVDGGCMGEMGIEAVSVAEAFGQADILSLHCPLTAETEAMVSAKTLAKMKPDAVLINTARGRLVDTEALTTALLDKRLRGAALDTTHPEPLPVSHRLHDLEQVILTPHMSWYSEEAEDRLRRQVAEEALRAVRKEPLLNQVN